MPLEPGHDFHRIFCGNESTNRVSSRFLAFSWLDGHFDFRKLSQRFRWARRVM